MPGFIHRLRCPGCRRSHEIQTGATRWRRDGPLVTFEPFVCNHCGKLESMSVEEGKSPDRIGCRRCRRIMEPWTGRVWHEETESRPDPEERVVGPCPRCGTQLDIREHSTGQRVLWD